MSTQEQVTIELVEALPSDTLSTYFLEIFTDIVEDDQQEESQDQETER